MAAISLFCPCKQPCGFELFYDSSAAIIAAGGSLHIWPLILLDGRGGFTSDWGSSF